MTWYTPEEIEMNEKAKAEVESEFLAALARYRWVGTAVLLLTVLLLPCITRTAATWLGMPITWEGAYIRAGYFLLAVVYVFGKWR